MKERGYIDGVRWPAERFASRFAEVGLWGPETHTE